MLKQKPCHVMARWLIGWFVMAGVAVAAEAQEHSVCVSTAAGGSSCSVEPSAAFNPLLLPGQAMRKDASDPIEGLWVSQNNQAIAMIVRQDGSHFDMYGVLVPGGTAAFGFVSAEKWETFEKRTDGSFKASNLCRTTSAPGQDFWINGAAHLEDQGNELVDESMVNAMCGPAAIDELIKWRKIRVVTNIQYEQY